MHALARRGSPALVPRKVVGLAWLGGLLLVETFCAKRLTFEKVGGSKVGWLVRFPSFTHNVGPPAAPTSGKNDDVVYVGRVFRKKKKHRASPQTNNSKTTNNLHKNTRTATERGLGRPVGRKAHDPRGPKKRDRAAADPGTVPGGVPDIADGTHAFAVAHDTTRRRKRRRHHAGPAQAARNHQRIQAYEPQPPQPERL